MKKALLGAVAAMALAVSPALAGPIAAGSNLSIVGIDNVTETQIILRVPGLYCTNGRKGDSSREFSVIAGWHEQTETADLQDQELARLQRGAQATRLAHDLVRSKDDVGSRADR
jgi:hypothetical protein